MTPSEIDALPAGRELDALVAERVMGVNCIHDLVCVTYEEELGRLLEEFHASEQRETTAWERSELENQANETTQWGDYPPKKCAKCGTTKWGNPTTRTLPGYSTDIAAAWEVVERLQRGAFRIQLDWLSPNGWLVSVGGGMGVANEDGVHGKGLPLMICRAALKAMA